jgi:hypothetical protein
MHEPTGRQLTGVTNFNLAARVTLHARGPLTGVWFEPLRCLRFLVSGRYDSNTFLRQAAGGISRGGHYQKELIPYLLSLLGLPNGLVGRRIIPTIGTIDSERQGWIQRCYKI